MIRTAFTTAPKLSKKSVPRQGTRYRGRGVGSSGPGVVGAPPVSTSVIRAGILGVLALGITSSCDRDGPKDTPPASASADAPAVPSSAAASAAPADAAPADAGRGSARSSSCPANMILVEGNFCPAAIQRCLEHHPEYLADKKVSERCMKYEEPSKCVSKQRKPMRFCIDRYEWPNEKGKKPLVLVQWTEAKEHCESIGKRLCDENEWLFACEGEEALPYSYGYTRDENKCLIDRPYRRRKLAFKRYDACMKDARCKEHFDHLDQREPIGSRPECISAFGVYDMNGNANEWVNLPGAKYPNRSGLKGGWWGPVRCRCRPTVKFHKEEDWGYEAGFRCCKDADADDAAANNDASD